MRIAIIGGGIAGLTAGALASKARHEVVIYEASREWGGCAGKFERGDYLFPAGATLGMGFEADGVHGRVLRHVNETVTVEPLDEVMHIHLDDRSVIYYQDRDRFLTELERKFPNEAVQIRSFMTEVWRDFETIRPLFERLPALPLRAAADVQLVLKSFHLNQLPTFSKLYETLGRTLDRHGLGGSSFERLIDGVLLDSLQTGAREASHLLGAVALSVYHEGAYYVEGGLYRLAHALERATQKFGGETHVGREIRQVTRTPDGWLLTDRRKRLDLVDAVVCAIPLEATARLLTGREARSFKRRYATKLKRTQWGAFSLYVTLPETVCAGRPLFQQVYHASLPTGHAFISMSAADDGLRTARPERTITVSTHLDLDEWRDWKDRTRYEKLETEWYERLLAVVRHAFPEWDGKTNLALPGGPGAWVKYTKRPHGAVGGYAQTPRQALFHAASFRSGLPGLYVCGDTVFPGAGTIGAMTSGLHVARAFGANIDEVGDAR